MDNNPNFNSGREIIAAATASIGSAAGWYGGLVVFLRDAGYPTPSVLKAIEYIHRYGVLLHDSYHPILQYLPPACGIAGGLLCGAAGWYAATTPAEFHIRGYRLRTNPKVIARRLKPHDKKLMGVRIHPRVTIDQHTECKHLLITGGSGGGKTTILRPIIDQARARGDRVLIFDFKGDFTSMLPDEKFALLSPTDARSRRWVIGRDIQTRLEAEALARTLIPDPDNGEKIWTTGARGLLVALIASLQKSHRDSWGFSQLAELSARALADYKTLVSIVEASNPQAKAYLMGADSKTTASFIAEMAGALEHVINLGVSAHSMRGARPWSVAGWLEGRYHHTTVLGYRESSKHLSQAYAASVIEQVVRQLSDMPDARPDQRRVWLFIDEAPRVGKVPSITDALTTLRSKGVRVVLGIQSLAQIREAYSRDTAQVWAGQCGLKLICNQAAPEDQRWCSDLLGDREVDRFQRQVSAVGTLNPNNSPATHSTSYQRVTEPVMPPSTFGADLKIIRGQGPRALMVGEGEAALLTWPFASQQTYREARVSAAWIRARYDRPVWGAVPPETHTPAVLEQTVARGGEQSRDIEDLQAPASAVAGLQGGVLTGPSVVLETSSRVETNDSGIVEDQARDHVLNALVPHAGLVNKIAAALTGPAGTPARKTTPTPKLPTRGRRESEHGEHE